MTGVQTCALPILGNTRLHVHTASGLMQDNFRASTMDYGPLMDCAFRLERHVNVYRKVLRLAAFNVFSHNRDDHSKNFSFLDISPFGGTCTFKSEGKS